MISIAQYGLIIILALFLVVHKSILLKFIPYNIIWGGKLKSDMEMYRFEIISIILNTFFLIIILIQSGFWMVNVPQKVITFIMWIMIGLFALNTFGNAISNNKFEQFVFTPITIILTILLLIVVLKN